MEPSLGARNPGELVAKAALWATQETHRCYDPCASTLNLDMVGTLTVSRAKNWKADMGDESLDLEDRFFALSIDLLCIARFNGYFKRLNPAWEKTLGFTREELQSKPMFEFVHPEDRERTLDQNRRVRSGEQALGFENRYRCKDGSYRWLLWNATADLDDQVIYSVARDITERKRAEQEREQLLRKLQAALAEVKELQKILPICMYCKSIRDDENYWQTVEAYVSHHTNTTFSHGICPTCYKNVVEPLLDDTKGG
jgi:PAS domain S-box-containing protein